MAIFIPFNSESLSTDDYFAPPLAFIIPFMLIFIAIPSIMIIVLVKAYKQAPAKADQMRKEKQEFLNSLDVLPDDIEMASSMGTDHKWSNTNLYCFQFGGAKDLKQSFYPSCGDSTTDEKEFVGNR